MRGTSIEPWVARPFFRSCRSIGARLFGKTSVCRRHKRSRPNVLVAPRVVSQPRRFREQTEQDGGLNARNRRGYPLRKTGHSDKKVELGRNASARRNGCAGRVGCLGWGGRDSPTRKILQVAAKKYVISGMAARTTYIYLYKPGYQDAAGRRFTQQFA